jgi:D-alanine-D-alanine ligase-like ATP-grasp enzyme
MSYVLHVVHGGIGEDGTIQTLLESAGVPYTGLLCSLYMVYMWANIRIYITIRSSCHAGPGPLASRTCMNKVATSLAVDHV